MPDLADGESVEMKGSAAKPYVLKNTGGVYSCSCPAWRNQSLPIEQRTCKHLKKLRGAEVEAQRVGTPPPRAVASATGTSKKSSGEKNPPPLLLAHKWDNQTDITGWWMSEKLDGVRAYWDGTQFVSRLGNRYIAPDWFVTGLPETPLDGELWAGRKQFQKTVSIVRRADAGQGWHDISFLIFDAPGHDGSFEERMAHVRQYLAEHECPHAQVVEHEQCTDIEHLERELARVEALGGEGLMLRQPGSRYQVGRSTTLLKVKTFHDAEAKVIGHTPGTGRHKGRLGALRVVTPGGIEFSVGTGFSDAEREDPPAIGAIITYRYQELSNANVPRFPTYVGVRHDFAWPDAEGGASAGASAGTSAGARKATGTAGKGGRKPAKKPRASKPANKASKPATASGSAPLPTVRAADDSSVVRYLELSDGMRPSWVLYSMLGFGKTTSPKSSKSDCSLVAMVRIFASTASSPPPGAWTGVELCRSACFFMKTVM